jgi:hypothetical protein
MLQALDSFLADRVSAHRGYTPEGYLICHGVPVARTGTQTYRAEEIDKDGKMNLSGLVDVYRSPEEVFKSASIQSFEGKSVVSPHPPQFLDSSNDSLYSKGHGQNFRAGSHPETGSPVLLADLVIKDETLAHLIEEGHRVEISAGYRYDLDRIDGEFDTRAKFAQKNIMGNHIAIVPTGRAGSDIRVLDSKPEEGDNMAEEATKPGVVSETLTSFASFFNSLGLRLSAKDEDPGAVERNRRKDEEALTKKSRVEDQKDEEIEKEDKKAGPPKPKPQGEDKKAKDSDDEDKKEDKKKEASDARLDRIVDALEKLVARDNKAEDKCTCDAEEDEPHKKGCSMYKKESEDADLIPIHRLHGDEIPKNPIPGADAALEKLRALKPLIAKSGDREAIDAYNSAVRQLKEGRDSDAEDGADYGDFTRMKKPEEVELAESRVAKDSKPRKKEAEDSSEDFAAAASKFHRMNPNEVKRQ